MAFNVFKELLQISVYGLLVMMFVGTGTVFIKTALMVRGHSTMAIAKFSRIPLD